MYKKCIWFIIVISLLMIIFVSIVYSFNYSIAWQKDIDHDATLSFVEIIGVILTPAVTIISTILYYSSLKEQRKQNKLLMEQQFDDKWQNLLSAHLKIRDEQQIKFEVLEKYNENKILLNGHFVFVALVERYLKLKEAINMNKTFMDLNEMIVYWKDYCGENSVHWSIIEQQNPIRYKKEMEDVSERKQIDYVGYLFEIKKDMNVEDVSKKAFELIYDKYLTRSSIYLAHFCSLLKFLERNKDIYSNKIKECVDSLEAVLTESEKSIILLYADYDIKNGELIRKYIKS